LAALLRIADAYDQRCAPYATQPNVAWKITRAYVELAQPGAVVLDSVRNYMHNAMRRLQLNMNDSERCGIRLTLRL
jgi:hypothetical protein